MPSPIDNARLWWGQNRDRVAAALPLTIGHETYTDRFARCMDVWIEANLTPEQTECYVLRPLRQIRTALTQQEAPS